MTTRVTSGSEARFAPGTINLVNIGLMLASLVIALCAPFELLLFSWVALGPLHYLTEISWLHDRKYFSQRATDPFVLLAISAALVLGTSSVVGKYALDPLLRWNPELTFLALGLAAIFAFVRSIGWRAVLAVPVCLVAWAIHGSLTSIFVFSLYVPTLVHVFLFTGCFLLVGARKNPAPFGLTAFCVFVLCGIATVLSSRLPLPFAPSVLAKAHYHFDSIVAIVSHHLGLADPPAGMERHPWFPFSSREAIFTSGAAIATARFVAFAYTYHYLNWFSKTSIIRWHAIPRGRGVAIVLLWIGAILLYVVDFEVGLAVLFFLSLAHVLLEFPLNHKTFAALLRH